MPDDERQRQRGATYWNSGVGTDTSSCDDDDLSCLPESIGYALKLIRRPSLDVKQRHLGQQLAVRFCGSASASQPSASSALSFERPAVEAASSRRFRGVSETPSSRPTDSTPCIRLSHSCCGRVRRPGLCACSGGSRMLMDRCGRSEAFGVIGAVHKSRVRLERRALSLGMLGFGIQGALASG